MSEEAEWFAVVETESTCRCDFSYTLDTLVVDSEFKTLSNGLPVVSLESRHSHRSSIIILRYMLSLKDAQMMGVFHVTDRSNDDGTDVVYA